MLFWTWTSEQLSDILWNIARKDRYNKMLAGEGPEAVGRAKYRDVFGLRHSWALAHLAFNAQPPTPGARPGTLKIGTEQVVGVIHIRWLIPPHPEEVRKGEEWPKKRLIFSVLFLPLVIFHRWRAR